MKEVPLREVWADAFRLFHEAEGRDLEHNAHGIFQLSFEAARMLTWNHNNPLAHQLALAIVNYYIGQYKAAHGGPWNEPGFTVTIPVERGELPLLI